MKKKTWIALLSVMLGATVVLAACKDDSDSDAGVPQAATQVESILSNFVNGQFKEDWSKLNGDSYYRTYLNEQYGNYVEHQNGFYLFKKVDRTPLDERSEVWTVYNAEKKEVSWTKEFKYQNGDYEGENQYGQEKHAPLEVHVEIDVEGEVPYIIVDTTEYVAYTETEMQEQLDMVLLDRLEEENIRSYKETKTVEYYSIDGKKICESYDILDVSEDNWSSAMGLLFGKVVDTPSILFGRTYATFDKDGNLLSTINEDTREGRIYAYQSDSYNYGYAIKAEGIGYEVYDKDDDLLYTYVINSLTSEADVAGTVRILQDGDFLIQKAEPTNGLDYDYIAEETDLEGDPTGKMVKYLVTTIRIDVDTGNQMEIDFPYVINHSGYYSKEDFAEVLGDEFALTDNVYNVAQATKIVDGQAGEDVYLFFDNLLNVQYEWSSMIEGHRFDLESIDVLKSNDLLVTLSTPLKMDGEVIDRAVITQEGNLVGYIPQNAIVFDGGMLLGGKVYSFAGKELFDVTKKTSYNYVNAWTMVEGSNQEFGSGYVWTMTKTEEITNPDNPDGPPTYKTQYKTFYLHEGGDSYGESYSITEYTGKIVECKGSYMLLETEEEYKICGANGSYSEVFSCKEQPLSIEEYENSLVVIVSSNGEEQVYEIKKHTEKQDFGMGY